MIPSTLVGVLLLLTALAPGHLYLRCYETRAARGPRAGAREIAEIAAIGAFFTVLGILTSMGLAQLSSWFYPLDGLLEGASYLQGHPWAAMASVALALGISVSGCAAIGTLAGVRRGGGQLRTSLGTPWTDALSTVQDQYTRPYAAIEMQDGRTLEGFVLSVAADQPPDERDIALRAPIMLTFSGGTRQELPSTFLIVPGAQVVLVTLMLVEFSKH